MTARRCGAGCGTTSGQPWPRRGGPGPEPRARTACRAGQAGWDLGESTPQRIRDAITAEQASESEDSFDRLEAEMAALREEVGGEAFAGALLEILEDEGSPELWYHAASLLFFGVSDGLPLPGRWQKAAAVLYDCLEASPGLGELGENLVWSIVHQLKGVPYDSDWDPRSDPEITAHRRGA